MYFRALNILLVLLGIFLSPTFKASFTPARTLKQFYSERVTLERKVHKPFESFYAAKAKRSCIKTNDLTSPSSDLVTFALSSQTFHFIALEGASLPNLRFSSHPQRGPPVI